MIKIYHNTQCSKSRECVMYFDVIKQPYEIVDYLNNPPTAEELKALIKKLGIKPIALVRQKEPIWLEKFEGRKLRSEQIIRAMVKYPILIERPIVVNGDKAVIARPLEKANEILKQPN